VRVRGASGNGVMDSACGSNEPSCIGEGNRLLLAGSQRGEGGIWLNRCCCFSGCSRRFSQL